MKKVPVFLINGFLESGKTQFILATIHRDEFYKRGKTLLLVCEEGENEYSPSDLEKYNVQIEYIEENQMTVDYLHSLYTKYQPQRIVIEMNLMWNQDKIIFPKYFELSQIISLIDGQTFPVYFANMRQQLIDIIKISDVVAFTKLSTRDSLKPFQTSLKMINSQCLYCLIDENCLSTQEAFDALLPYNIEDKEIVISDDDFGIFYIDTFDHRNDYQNKIVTFNAWVVKSDKLKNEEFIAGRKVLNCCAQDIQLYGFLVKSSLGMDLKHDSWIKLKAQCQIEYNDEYQEEEIILTPLEIKIIDEIEKPILDLR